MTLQFNFFGRLWLLPLLITLSTKADASDLGFRELDAWQLESAMSLAQRALKEDRNDPKALW